MGGRLGGMARKKAPQSRQADELRRAMKKFGTLWFNWGAQGGFTRAKKLTAEQRREIARKAAAARWAKKRRA